jgi:hypothetical protein
VVAVPPNQEELIDPKKLAAVEDTGDRDRFTAEFLAAADVFGSEKADEGRRLLLEGRACCPPTPAPPAAAIGSSWNRWGGALHMDMMLGWSAVVLLFVDGGGL